MSFIWIVQLFWVFMVIGINDGATDSIGALVSVDAISTVGVKYDEFPQDSWDLAKALIDTKDDNYWRSLAVQQFKLTMIRFSFRPMSYPNITAPQYRGTLALTLPQFWNITFLGPPRSVQIDSHHHIVRDFKFHVTLITDTTSVVKSDDRLTNIGGSFVENFTFPVDPMLLVQRTGTACMNENSWPPNSIDPETTEYFYDDTCKAEAPQAPALVGCQQCHCHHPLPTMSCVDALKAYVGHVNVGIKFTRMEYYKEVADQWRYPSQPSTNSLGQVAPVNLREYEPGLQNYRIVYLYIQPDGCELAERCVGGSGWRRLLLFSTMVPNLGTQNLHLGEIFYFLRGPPTDIVTKHHVFEYSPCHKHFHFLHYGSFILGDENEKSSLTNSKRGFCLVSVNRLANAEWSPLGQDYYQCSVQGIAAGWQDIYQGGLRCQWIDVTPINTTMQSHTTTLSSTLNPDGFLCEGIPKPDTWIRTEFNTTCCGGNHCCGESNATQCCGGQPVERMGCDIWNEAKDDNRAVVPVTLPLSGEGQLTERCWNSSGSWGEKRDCGMKLHPDGKFLTCDKPGQQVALKNVVASDFYQVVRICEASIALQSGLACIWNASLASVVVDYRGKPTDINFICPPARDEIETGGRFSVYYGPLFSDMAFRDLSWSGIA